MVYCGTPCQIAGLRSYLKGIDQSRLLAIDFICHGVPSPLIYRDHVRWLTKGPIKNVDFRSKRMGAKHCLLVEDSRGEKVYPKSATHPHWSFGALSDQARKPEKGADDFAGIRAAPSVVKLRGESDSSATRHK